MRCSMNKDKIKERLEGLLRDDFNINMTPELEDSHLLGYPFNLSSIDLLILYMKVKEIFCCEVSNIQIEYGEFSSFTKILKIIENDR